MTKLLLYVCLAIATLGAPALAQPEVVVVSPSEIRVMETPEAEARLAELEKAYQDVRTRPPKAGLIVSGLLIGGGASMMAVGMSLNRCWSDGASVCREPGSTALAVSGAVVLLGSIAGLALSSVRLRRAKEQKARLKRKMRQLDGTMLPADR
ncbi:MAG: hypothetical protein WBM46_10905 [Polyangiales bacterium]